MAFEESDRRLLQSCLAREPRAWEAFVDRFVGLVLHVIDHASQSRTAPLGVEDKEDLVAEVFVELLHDDFRVLRRFRGDSSLATYLTVVARRVVVRGLGQRRPTATLESVRQSVRSGRTPGYPVEDARQAAPEQRISDEEEIERMLSRLNGAEAEVVRMYHLEGKSYREISDQVGMPENSIGPTLSRARTKMRQASADSTLG